MSNIKAVSTARGLSILGTRFFNRELSWLAFNARVLEELSLAARAAPEAMTRAAARRAARDAVAVVARELHHTPAGWA